MTREEAKKCLTGMSWKLGTMSVEYITEKDGEKMRECIEALEQEPCEDLMAIHTQGLDEGIRCAMCTNSMKSDRGCDGGCVVDNVMYKKVIETIANHIVPLVTPTQKWIPVSERLPEDYETVLIQFVDSSNGISMNDYSSCELSWMRVDGSFVTQSGRFEESEILAWMPLPEPFKEE